MIFLSPLLFGAGEDPFLHVLGNPWNHELTSLDTAHLHHAWETYNRYGRSPAAMKRAAIGTGETVSAAASISHLPDQILIWPSLSIYLH